MKLAQAELEKNQIHNKKLNNWSAKNRVFQVIDKVLVLLLTDQNKILTQWKDPFDVNACKGGNIGGVDQIVVGANADNVKEQEDVSVDNKKLLELGVLRPKQSISDVCLRVELSIEQHNEIMGVLGKREKSFTDTPERLTQ